MNTLTKSQGFTLVELLVALSIGAILLSIAVPGWQTMMQNNRLSSEANKFTSALYLARNEAVKRGNSVTICPRAHPRTNPESCAGNIDWGKGWLLFTDETGTAGQFDTTDTLIQVWDSVQGTTALIATRNDLRFQSSGNASALTSFTLSSPSCTGNQIRNISVGLSGRAAVSTSACPSS